MKQNQLKLILFNYIFIALVAQGNAQNLIPQWIKLNEANDECKLSGRNAINTDTADNVFTSFTFRGTVKIDSASGFKNIKNLSQSPTTQRDVMLTKRNKNGVLLNYYHFNTYQDELVDYSSVDIAGNFYMMGRGTGGIAITTKENGNEIIYNNGSDDIYLIKFDNSLTPEWIRSWKTNQSEVFGYVTILNNGDIAVGGNFLGTIDANPNSGTDNLTAVNGGSFSSFLSILDSKGKYKRGAVVGTGTGHSVIFDVKQNKKGIIYLNGSVNGRIDVDPSNNQSVMQSAGDRNNFISCLDTNLNYIDAAIISCNDNTEAVDIAFIDSSVVVAGYFSGTADADPLNATKNMVSNGSHDIYVIKLDYLLNHQWHVNFGSSTFDELLDVEIDNNQNIHIGGSYSGNIDLDPTSGVKNFTNNNTTGFWVMMTKNGGFLNANGFNSNSGRVCGITHDKFGSLTMAMNPGTGNLNYDIRAGRNRSKSYNGVAASSVVQYSICNAKSDTTKAKDCRMYKIGNNTVFTSGIYKMANADTMACQDSLIYNINIENHIATATKTNDTLKSPKADSYQWLSCDNNTPEQNANTQWFKPTATGNYAVITSKNSCLDTSNCINYVVNNNSLKAFATNGFSLYPNPANSYISIQLNTTIEQLNTVKIINQLGICVLEKNEANLNISQLPQGLYFITIITNKGNYNSKFVKH